MTRLIMMQCYTASFQLPTKLSSSCLSTHYSTPLCLYTPSPQGTYINVHKRITESATRKCSIGHFQDLDRTTLCTVHKNPCTNSDQSSQPCHQRLHALELFVQLPDILGAVLIFRAACLGNQCRTFSLGFRNFDLQ